MKHPLAAYRERHRLTLDHVAKRVETTKATISRIENYKQDPSLSLIRRFVTEFNGELRADDFLNEKETAAPTSGAAA